MNSLIKGLAQNPYTNHISFLYWPIIPIALDYFIPELNSLKLFLLGVWLGLIMRELTRKYYDTLTQNMSNAIVKVGTDMSGMFHILEKNKEHLTNLHTEEQKLLKDYTEMFDIVYRQPNKPTPWETFLKYKREMNNE